MKKRKAIIDSILSKYEIWKHNRNEHEKLFLQYLEDLQGKILSDLVKILGDKKFDKAERQKEPTRYKININEYKSFMKDVYPLLKEFENEQMSISGIIQESYNFKGNENYWNMLKDIRKGAMEINIAIYEYYRFWFNSFFDSSDSRFWIKLSLKILIIFDILIPFYMIQPNQIGILPYKLVFYITILSLVFCYIFIVLAYEKRYKYPSISEESQQNTQLED